MVLPTTWLSVVLLLGLSFICLGSWASTYKATGRWRFELFSIDFAVGALLVSLLAAYTLGTLGADLGFSDRMLVAGRTNQALGLAAGAVFALGNMLLLATISLIGMSGAFPLCIGSAALVAGLYELRNGVSSWLIAGLAVLAAALIVTILAIRSTRSAVRTANPRPGVRGPAKKNTSWKKGIIVGLISGITLAGFFVMLYRGFRGEFGLGPYAALLLVAISLLVSTVVLDLYFMNIAISGGPIGFGAYFTGLPHQHFFGFAGGAVWAVGMLAQGLAMSAPSSLDLEPAFKTIVPLASVVLAVLWGLVKWKEFAAKAGTPASHTKLLLAVSSAIFLGGAILLGLAGWS